VERELYSNLGWDGNQKFCSEMIPLFTKIVVPNDFHGIIFNLMVLEHQHSSADVKLKHC